MFDRSFLPPAAFEFVVVTDTHYMIDPGGQAVEFNSRRRQTARAEFALRRIAAMDAPLVIHLGDLVQEFPERPVFRQAVDEALAQFERCGVSFRLVAGNHDVGDKPDPTMPADPVLPEYLAAYHQRFGPSWYSWDQGGLHFIVLNSQILNSSLPEAAQQQAWLEAELATHRDKRHVVMLHLPPFLHDPQEPHLGHYDNIGEPARSWLLGQLAQANVELVLAAHVHFAFHSRIGSAEYYTVPSTAFTRPGFSDLFASAAPPEQGRDDTGKLGFFLFRLQDGDLRHYFIRTGGTELAPDAPADTAAAIAAAAPTLLTRTTPDLPASPLGVSLRHPISHTTQVPIAWPSQIRQPVHNAYPYLSCIELGVRHLRVPWHDLLDPEQSDRLAQLRIKGATLTATLPWHDSQDGAALTAPLPAAMFDTLELQLLGTTTPSAKTLDLLQSLRRDKPYSVALSTILSGRYMPGKQHARHQREYLPDQLEELNRQLAAQGVELDRVVCRMNAQDDAWTLLPQVTRQRHSHIRQIDWTLELSSDDAQSERLACLALLAAAQCPGVRLFVEPLRDLDRTMDVNHGLLDRLCNPRPIFHTLRHLNTLLFADDGAWQPLDLAAHNGSPVYRLRRGDQQIAFLPNGAAAGESLACLLDDVDPAQQRLLDLHTGTLHAPSATPATIDSPALIYSIPASQNIRSMIS